MIEIYAVKLNENLSKSEFEELAMHVSKDKYDRVKRFRKYEDAQRTLIADLMVRYSVCNKLNIRNDEIVFDKNEFGKPYLKNSDTFHFNISHSGKWIVCAVGNLPIGIDVEMIQPVDLNIAERYFSTMECRDLMNKSIRERTTCFYGLWTLKESYIKADGKGLSIPLDSFSIIFGNNAIRIETENKFKDCFFKQYDIDIGYKTAVCACSDEFPEKVSIWNVYDFYI